MQENIEFDEIVGTECSEKIKFKTRYGMWLEYSQQIAETQPLNTESSQILLSKPNEFDEVAKEILKKNKSNKIQ